MTEKKISRLTATNIVVANMIGVGVFTSLGFQVIGIHSHFALMSLWLIGGLISLCGALSYAELAAGSNAVAASIQRELGDDQSPVIVLGHKQPAMLLGFLGLGFAFRQSRRKVSFA